MPIRARFEPQRFASGPASGALTLGVLRTGLLGGDGVRRWLRPMAHVDAPAALYLLWKRTLDVVVSLSAGLALLPVLAIVALLIRAQDGGPALYWQTRVGKRGRHFPFPKFRSMGVDAEARRAQLQARNEDPDGVKFKMRHDPRITPLGRFLRKYSIDELPQLWCVLRGDMTLVGPRPPMVSEVPAYSAEDWGRLDVVPGLTCLWQVRGRSDLSFREQVALDLEYIRTSGPLTDLKILVQTVPAVLLGRGAY